MLYRLVFTRSGRMLLAARNRNAHYCGTVRWKSEGGGGDCEASSRIGMDLSDVDLGRIRNFSVVAHVDHGKSTLADRILEHAGAVDRHKDNKQILDRLEVERERGITVKAQTASITHTFGGRKYLLNLIDTPGHVDFSAEVSRSLLASQGVVLLVCAKDGVQAQTVSNFYLAFAADLAIVPALNKVDLAGADPDRVKEQMRNVLEIDPGEVLLASAKTGRGIQEILDAVVQRIPAPSPEKYGNK